MIAVLVSACMPIQPQVEELEPVGLRSDAPEYAKRGPYWVGYTPLVIGEGTERQLDAGLWYPALNPSGKEEAVTYEITMKMPELQKRHAIVVYGSALSGRAHRRCQRDRIRWWSSHMGLVSTRRRTTPYSNTMPLMGSLFSLLSTWKRIGSKV